MWPRSRSPTGRRLIAIAGEHTVECGYHGPSRASFVCRHLAASLSGGPVGLGFFTPYDADEDTEDDDPQAWCAVCEKAWVAEGEWNERSEAVLGLTVICEGCYRDARAANELPAT